MIAIDIVGPIFLLLSCLLSTYLILSHRIQTSLPSKTSTTTISPLPTTHKFNRQSKKSKSNLRYAEKSRHATCLFADRVAQLVLQKYKATCPSELQSSYNQTVLAGFLLEDITTNTLSCVALGVGTKYVNSAIFKLDSQGQRVHDAHAEILAKRSLHHYLYTQLVHILSNHHDSIFVAHSCKFLPNI